MSDEMAIKLMLWAWAICLPIILASVALSAIRGTL